MKSDDAAKVINAITTAVRGLIDDNPNARGALASPAPNGKPAAAAKEPFMAAPNRNEFTQLVDAVYQAIVDRAKNDPVLLNLLMTQNELVVEFEPRVVTVAGDTLRGRVARLIVDGWFDQEKSTGGTRRELARTGTDPGGGGQLSDVLASYVRDGFLVRAGDGYGKAPNIKVSEKELVAR